MATEKDTKTVTKRIKQGPNKGDLIKAKFSPKKKGKRRKWFPVEVIEDVGKPSTLRNNPGIPIGKKKKAKKKK